MITPREFTDSLTAELKVTLGDLAPTPLFDDSGGQSKVTWKAGDRRDIHLAWGPFDGDVTFSSKAGPEPEPVPSVLWDEAAERNLRAQITEFFCKGA